MGPIDYSMDVLNPIEGYMQGLKFGEGILTDRLNRDATTQNMGIQREQMDLAQAQFAAQEQARAQQMAAAQAQAEAAKARAGAMRDALVSVYDGLESGDVSTGDILRITAEYPELTDPIQAAKASFSEDRIANETGFGQQLVFALSNGNTDTARDLLSERQQAAEAAGDAQGAAVYKAQLLELEQDPNALKMQTVLGLSQLMDKEQFETFGGIVGLGGDTVKPQSAIAQLQSDLDAGLINQSQYDLAVANMAGPGMELVTNADGTTTFRTGPGVGAGGGDAPTERQSTLALFSNLMDETMPAIAELENSDTFDPASLGEGVASRGGWIGNYLRSPEGQRYEALQRQWAEGVLRIQTGAAATQDEINRVMETYFPQPGDTLDTVRQKSQQRDIFARALVPASGGNIAAPGGASDRAGIGGGVTAQSVATMDQTQLNEYIAQTPLSEIPTEVLDAIVRRQSQ